MAESRAVDSSRSDDDMEEVHRIGRRFRQVGPDALVVVAALAAGAAVVAVLERLAGIDNAAAAFLLAVVTVAVLRGTGPAIATAVGSFLVYDFLFIPPYYTLTVADAGEWLNLGLLLVVGVVVGRLAGRQRERAEAALEGQRAALAMFNVSFTLSTERDLATALRSIARMLAKEVAASRVWIAVGEAVAADTAPAGSPLAVNPPLHATLRRRPGDEPADWVRVHAAGKASTATAARPSNAYRVAISAGGRTLGAIWLIRSRRLGDPDEREKRILSAAADQIAGSLERSRLQQEATSAEVSRRSDALKSALLDSVSHDLRTPLATIRAAAGTLMDPEIDWPPDQRRDIAASIDREAEWLNRLVTNLLDMSRVEAGELRPNHVVLAVEDVIEEAIGRASAALGDRPITVDVSPDLPPILVDEVLIGQVLANTLDNAAKYAGAEAPVRVSAHETGDHRIRITVEDGGSGVPPETLPRLFEKFYRVPRRGEGSRRGTGIGLAVVQGIVEAMGGRVEARRSDLGGLALDIDFPIAAVDDEDPLPAQAVERAG